MPATDATIAPPPAEVTRPEAMTLAQATTPVRPRRAAASIEGFRAKLTGFAPVIAALLALAVHASVRNAPDAGAPGLYTRALGVVLIVMLVLGLSHLFFVPFRRWYATKAPIYAGAVAVLCAWELITTKFRALPLPYFPGPEMVLRSLVDDWRLLAESTYHSLALLLSGYVLGVILGVTSGVLIGWSPRVRYWAMPVLKVIGPIPAPAWIPLALVLFPTSFAGGVAMIAMAVWFPVTMLTSSGVSNVRVSYLDVARTLGAGRAFLIFRVAVPSALPSIFIGLFMGLCTSFLTLMAAEMLGVQAGLGWYVNWAQAWAEYAKVYGALIIIAAFFSSIMTLLFKLRDRVLVWQKGVIKW